MTMTEDFFVGVIIGFMIAFLIVAAVVGSSSRIR